EKCTQTRCRNCCKGHQASVSGPKSQGDEKKTKKKRCRSAARTKSVVRRQSASSVTHRQGPERCQHEVRQAARDGQAGRRHVGRALTEIVRRYQGGEQHGVR